MICWSFITCGVERHNKIRRDILMTEHQSCCGGKSSQKTAILYRMVMEKHICPYGIKSKDLLEREGYVVDDNHLTNRAETDAFKQKHGVETTPQTFIPTRAQNGHCLSLFRRSVLPGVACKPC